MDFLSPPMYDVSNIDMWKFKMSAYLKALRSHVYLATTKKSYLGNDKHESTPRGGVNRCKANLITNYAELKTNCNTLSVTKECS